MFTTSIPLARNPFDSASLSSTLDSLPSKPIAVVVPPARATMEPKQRPMAHASAVDKVRPTMPRMSYSRSEVGSKSCLNVMVAARSMIMFQEAAHRVRELRPFQGEGDLRFQISHFVAAIETFAFVAQTVERLIANQLRHAVGQLDLIAGATLQRFQMDDHFRHQNIAADDRQRRRRDVGRGLFDQAEYLDQFPVIGAGFQDAISVGVFARHVYDRDDVAAGPRVGF